MNDYRLKLTKLDNNNSSAPQFSLTYSVKKTLSIEAGYDILSRLKGDNDLIVEVSGSIILGNASPNKVTSDFLRNTRSLNLEFEAKQKEIPSRFSIFGIPLLNQKTEVIDEIFAYIPNEAWNKFMSFMPVHGARYYITPKPENPKELIRKTIRMTERERAENFDLTVYHAASLCQFGLWSAIYGEDDLKKILGI